MSLGLTRRGKPPPKPNGLARKARIVAAVFTPRDRARLKSPSVPPADLRLSPTSNNLSVTKPTPFPITIRPISEFGSPMSDHVQSDQRLWVTDVRSCSDRSANLGHPCPIIVRAFRNIGLPMYFDTRSLLSVRMGSFKGRGVVPSRRVIAFWRLQICSQKALHGFN